MVSLPWCPHKSFGQVAGDELTGRLIVLHGHWASGGPPRGLNVALYLNSHVFELQLVESKVLTCLSNVFLSRRCTKFYFSQLLYI